MVILSPLFDLAGLYREPFAIATKESLEIAFANKKIIEKLSQVLS
ncbi:hypothetical protein [Nostoc sp. LEGE 06077]|nr:hypothetical protein [Nostoc sp. LEGE 06077]